MYIKYLIKSYKNFSSLTTVLITMTFTLWLLAIYLLLNKCRCWETVVKTKLESDDWMNQKWEIMNVTITILCKPIMEHINNVYLFEEQTKQIFVYLKNIYFLSLYLLFILSKGYKISTWKMIIITMVLFIRNNLFQFIGR